MRVTPLSCCWLHLLYLLYKHSNLLTKMLPFHSLKLGLYLCSLYHCQNSGKPSLYLLLPLNHSVPHILQFGFYFLQFAEMIVSGVRKYVQIAILIPIVHISEASETADHHPSWNSPLVSKGLLVLLLSLQPFHLFPSWSFFLLHLPKHKMSPKKLYYILLLRAHPLPVSAVSLWR